MTTLAGETQPPRQWVERFEDSESEVRGVLDDIREAHLLGNYEDVRERLRAFATAEDGIFRLVALVVADVESFYDDLEAQYDEAEPPTEELRALGDEYDRLAEELELVFTEQVNGLRNPMPNLRRGFQYSQSTNLPRLDYDLYSGDVKLCQFVHHPSQALVLARSVVGSTRELLERVAENDDRISEFERERLAAVYDALEEEMASLDELVEERGDQPDDAGELDPYDDWSFY